MVKINIKDVPEIERLSPKAKFGVARKHVSEALGRKPLSTDLNERHPFDIEICRILPGKANFPFHSHSAQWEFFQVIAGKGVVRDGHGNTPVEVGDAFLFKPGEAHQITNDGMDDLVLCVVADNPVGESTHYPDSQKWIVRSPQHRVVRSEPLDYYEGEE